MDEDAEAAVDFLWTYSPSDFFPEPVHIQAAGCKLVIDDGKVTARVDATVYKANDRIQDDLRRAAYARFLEEQIAANKPFELSDLRSKCLVRADGTNSDVRVLIQPFPEVRTRMSGTVDTLIVEDGKVVKDTARDRRERYRRIAELAAKYASDDVVKRVLASRQSASENPDYELVHRYAILDALREKFGKNAKTVLGISDNDWSRLETLANGLPVRQGRHEGTKLQDLRDATDAELTEAREIELRMFEAYLVWLEKQNAGKP